MLNDAKWDSPDVPPPAKMRDEMGRKNITNEMKFPQEKKPHTNTLKCDEKGHRQKRMKKKVEMIWWLIVEDLLWKDFLCVFIRPRKAEGIQNPTSNRQFWNKSAVAGNCVFGLFADVIEKEVKETKRDDDELRRKMKERNKKLLGEIRWWREELT